MMFPKNLLVQSDGISAAIRAFPTWFNRDQRRALAGKLKKRYPSARTNEQIILCYLRDPIARRTAFWASMRAVSSDGDAETRQRPHISLDFYLLNRMLPSWTTIPIDVAKIKNEWLGVAELRGKLSKPIPQDDQSFFLPWTVWEEVQKKLNLWKTNDEAERHRIVNAVYSLCGIYACDWFLQQARAMIEDIDEFYIDHLQNTEPNTEPKSLAEQWKTNWSTLQVLSNEATGSAPNVIHLDRLSEIYTALHGIKERIEKPGEPPSFENELGALKDILQAATVNNDSPFLSGSLVDQIVLAWRGACVDRPIAEMASVLAIACAEVKRLASALTERYAALAETQNKVNELSGQLSAVASPAKRKEMLHELSLAEGLFKAEVRLLIESQEGLIGVAMPEGKSIDWDSLAPPEKVLEVGASVSPLIDFPPAEEGYPGGGAITRFPVVIVAPIDQPSVGVPPVPPLAGTVTHTPWNDPDGERCSPIWNAILRSKFALAYQISRALHDAEEELRAPPPALLRAVALANFVRSGDGHIARELGRLYEEFDKHWFEEGPRSWSVGLNLLLVAASLYPSLIAPVTGASGVLGYRHFPDGLDALHELCIGVSDCGAKLQGLNLNPAALGRLSGVAVWQSEFDALKQSTLDWRSRAPKMLFKYQPAAAVWKHWLTPDSTIGKLLLGISDVDAASIQEVRDIVQMLSDTDRFADLVQYADRRELKRRRGDDINYGALTQLRERSQEAAELGRKWLELMEVRPDKSDYLVRQLKELGGTVEELSRQIQTQLDEISQTFASKWQLIPAGAAAVRNAVTAIEKLFQAGPHGKEPEPNVDQLVGGPVLLASALDLDEEWRPQAAPKHILECLVPLVTVTDDWKSAFGERVNRGDLDGAEKIVSICNDNGFLETSQFQTSLGEALTDRRYVYKRDLTQTRNSVETAIAYGYINEQERARLDAALVEVEAGFDVIRNFPVANERLLEFEVELRKKREGKLTQVREQLTALKLTKGSDAEKKLLEVIDSGDVLTANEYLQRVRAGETLTNVGDVAVDSFTEFFPSGMEKMSEYLDIPENSLIKFAAALLEQPLPGDLKFTKLSDEQAKTANETVTAWLALIRGQKGNGDLLKKLLLGIGFSKASLTGLPSRNGRIEYELNAERISDKTVCPVPQYGSQAAGMYRLLCLFSKPTATDLMRFVGDDPGGRSCLVFYFGRLKDADRRELAKLSREQRRSFLILDELLLAYICSTPKSRLATFFHCAVPFSYIDPFVTTSGLVPPEMFFGRADELNAVQELNGRCFIYGGRQLGKTALLREAERSFHSPDGGRFAKWIDLKAEGIGLNREPAEMWVVLCRELKGLRLFPADFIGPVVTKRGSIDAFIDSLKSWFSQSPNRRILLLLDEADRFLEQDGRNEYQETSRLKNLMESTGRRFKVVFAGLHNVLRTTEQANHPLAHLGDPIEIGPLIRSGDWREARSLIVKPLKVAGYEFVSEDLSVRILAQTNYYPSLIQLYGAQLLKQIRSQHEINGRSGPRYPITEALVDETYRTRELGDAIRSRFHLTLQLDPRYELVTYALAYALTEGAVTFEAGVDLRELKDMALAWWSEGFHGTNDHEFQILLNEMVGLGVLRHTGERGYSLRNPNVLLLMGGIEAILSSLEKNRELPQEFEPNVFRAHLPRESGARRSPLSYGQESEFLRRENAVSILVGNVASGIEDVVPFLLERVPNEFIKRLDAPASKDSFSRFLDGIERRTDGGTSLFIVPFESKWHESWVQLALDRLSRLTSSEKHVRVVFIADSKLAKVMLPALTELEEAGARLMSLRPWSERFLRQWLQDLGITDGDPEIRNSLAAISGLWPSLLVRAAVGIKSGQRARQLCAVLEQALQDEKTRAEVLVELGLSDKSAIAALKLVADVSVLSDEDLDAFAQMEGLDPADTRSWIRWAEMLQLVVRSGSKAWCLDPFVKTLIGQKLSGI